MSNDQTVDYDKGDGPPMQYHAQNNFDYTLNSNIESISLPEPAQDDAVFERALLVLTLNCWGLWWVAKLRPERIRGIVRFIRDNNCDVVFLQEVWVQSDFEFIRDNTSDIYRFAHHYKSGSLLKTSGVVILSKWAPKVIHFEPYVLNGSPFYFWHGDWFAGKGVAYARVDLDHNMSLHLFSTHTHAYYKENERVLDQYSIHRVCQSYQLARFINFISDTACNRRGNTLDLIVVAGDFNCTSSEMPYRIVTSMANLTDCLKLSRNNGTSSYNIIHAFKIRPNNLPSSNDSADSSSIDGSNIGNCIPEIRGLLGGSRKQRGDTFILEEYGQKIAHILFDSDTEDEDSTYCHPKNSFTGCKLTKTVMPAANSASIISGATNSIDNKFKLSDGVVTGPGESQKSHTSCSAGASRSSGLDSVNDSPKRSARKNKKSNMKRIDFILCRLLGHGRCIIDRTTVEGKDPQLDCSLSDHEPVMVELRVSHHDKSSGNANNYESSNASSSGSSNSRPIHKRTHNVISDLRPPVAEPEETTERMTPVNHFSFNETYNENSLKVMEQFQEILRQYYRYNGKYKFRMLLLVLLVFITIMPLISYYGIAHDLLPPSTIVLMWLFALLIISAGSLAGFMSYRIEQSAIEATLNDIACRINVAKIKQK